MSKKSFTIIELLVVISVVFILIGVVVSRFKEIRDEANVAKSKAETKVLQTALESFYVNQSPNFYPAGSTPVLASYLNIASPLIVGIPLYDPFRSPETEYSYILSSNGLYYVVFSYGVDRMADIAGISPEGILLGVNDDDIYATNGIGF